MTLKKRLTVAMLAVASIALAACLPNSINAIPDSDGEPVDQALCGNWIADEGDNAAAPAYLEVTCGDDKMTFQLTATSDGGKTEKSSYEAWRARAGDNQYLNIKILSMGDEPVSPPPEPEPGAEPEEQLGYLIFSYVADGGAFDLRFMQDAAITAAINSGAIKGVVDTTKMRIQITAPAEELAAYFATQEAAALFVPPAGEDPNKGLIHFRRNP